MRHEQNKFVEIGGATFWETVPKVAVRGKNLSECNLHLNRRLELVEGTRVVYLNNHLGMSSRAVRSLRRLVSEKGVADLKRIPHLQGHEAALNPIDVWHQYSNLVLIWLL